MKKSIKRSISLVLAAAALILCFNFPDALGSVAYAEEQSITLNPDASDGVALTYTEEDVTIHGELHYGVFTFSETKLLSITASFDEGWGYCEDYSLFFPNNRNRVSIVTNSNGSMTFTFDARQGENVSSEDLFAIGIYATAAQLPKLEINIGIPFSQVGKENWVDATFNLTLGTKQFASGNYSGTGSVKGRGNTSWGQPKKPYSIKLSSKASLLDIPRTKKYAIVASYSDASLMRNFITYKAGLLLSGIDYTPKCEFVEVYLNGSYNGIYLLVERVDIESNKIDIEEADADNLTGGYLIEKDVDGKIDYSSDLWFNCPYWANQSKDYFVLKTPEPEDAELTRAMLDYLEDYMQSVHNSIMRIGNESYTKYVDADSWIDFMLMQEITKNIDGNLKTSCYMYKQRDDDKLYMTALWDFDLAYGGADWDNADYTHNDYYDCPNGTGVAGFMAINSSSPWFDHLYDDYPEFREALIAKYNEYHETLIPKMRAMMNEQAAYLLQAAPRNDAMWYNDFEYGVDGLMDWFDGRIDWLDRHWYEGEDAIDLNTALNAEGGTLMFSVEDFDFPFVGIAVDGRIAGVSDNSGMNSSSSSVKLTLNMQQGETLTFDYKVSSEQNYDKFIFEANGSQIFAESGEIAWRSYTFTAPSTGSYTFEWEYEKDQSVANGADCAWLDNVRYSGNQSSFAAGDVDMDGRVSVTDALLVMRHAMGLISLTPEQLLLADFDGNGEANMLDGVGIMRHALGL